MELDTLKDLYVEELKDLYSAEKQLVKALPKMIKATKHPELKAAFKTHLQQTGEHARRLEQICEELGVSPRGKKCVGMEGLIEEGSELIKEKPDDDVHEKNRPGRPVSFFFGVTNPVVLISLMSPAASPISPAGLGVVAAPSLLQARREVAAHL